MKKVNWVQLFLTLKEGIQFLWVEGLQILVIHKIQLLKFIQALCSLEIFLVYLHVS